MKHRRARVASIPPAAIALVIGCCCAAASASEGGSPLQEDRWSNALWALGLFAVLLIVLGRFAFKPVMKAMHDRDQTLRDIAQEAERRRAESEELLQEYRERLKHAEAEAEDMLDRARKQAAETREEILEDARKQAAGAIEEAERRIEAAGRQAMSELYAQTADLAGEVASRLIGRELNDADHARIIVNRLRQLEKVDDPDGDARA